MIEQGERDTNEREEKVEREEMGVCRRMTWFNDVQDIVCHNTKRNNDTLTCFNTVDTSEDIDCIGAKDA
jgi:hypothetical protein